MEKDMGKITKLAVFDFDGTLVDTPLPEFGKQEYKKKTGEEWPHTGWWGQSLSLNHKIFDMPTVPMVMSGAYVKYILDDKGLTFDEYHYNRGGSTEVAKLKTLEELLFRYSDVQVVEMWDDRDEHLPIFQEWGDRKVKEGRLKDFKINHVPQDRH